MFQKKNCSWLVLFLFIGLGLACDQTSKANKLVSEANLNITKSNELAAKSGKIFGDIFDDSFLKADDLEAYKKENKSKLDELISLREQIEKEGTEAINKFEQASKLKIDERYQEYLIYRLKEFDKRAEADKLFAPFVKSFLEAKDVSALDVLIDDFRTKTDEIGKAADEFMITAEEIEKNNRDVIKAE